MTSGEKRSAEPPKPAKRKWAMRDRMSTQMIVDLLAAYQAGSIGKELAEDYNISLSSVKRILHANHGRLKDHPEA